MAHDDAIVITTAPSERQVRELLWREIRNLHIPRRHTIGGRLTRTRLDFSPKRYAYGFSTNTEERFQGFHSPNIMVIVDEASGVDEFIFQAITGIRNVDNSRLLLIGNPHGYAGTFYNAFHGNRRLFETIHISAFDLPAFKQAQLTPENIADYQFPATADLIDAPNQDDGKSPVGLSTPQWAVELYNSYGPNSSVYQTRVLGEFPTEADDTLIPLRDIEAAVGRNVDHHIGERRLGNGNRRRKIRRRQDRHHGPQSASRSSISKSCENQTLTNTTGVAIAIARKFNLNDIFVDEVGIGAGVLDNLEQEKYNARGINGGNRADNPERFANLRAEIFDGLRQRLAMQTFAFRTTPNLFPN